MGSSPPCLRGLLIAEHVSFLTPVTTAPEPGDVRGWDSVTPRSDRAEGTTKHPLVGRASVAALSHGRRIAVGWWTPRVTARSATAATPVEWCGGRVVLIGTLMPGQRARSGSRSRLISLVWVVRDHPGARVEVDCRLDLGGDRVGGDFVGVGSEPVPPFLRVVGSAVSGGPGLGWGALRWPGPVRLGGGPE
jgi:hypothetical protein